MSESYANLFGTNGSGTQNRIGSLFGQQSATQVQNLNSTQTQTQPQQTFAQMQQAGQARPAPAPPTPNAYAPYQGSQQAQAVRAPMLQAVQQQLAQPTRFDTQAFQQMRAAQAANLQSEFTDQQRALNEDLARRGLSASTIGAAGLGRLAGAQSRALADIDAQLLQQAAQTQAQDRLAALQAGGQFAELAGAQDLAEFEARRVGQAQQFQEGLASAQFAQQNAQFLQTLTADERRFVQTMEEQRAARIQQLGLSTRELDMQAAKMQQDAQLQGRSLSLQEARDAAEIEFRVQSLQQQAQLQGRSLDIEQARNEATIGLQRDQMAMEQGLREAGLDIDRQRLLQAEQQFTAQLAQQESQFGRTLGETALDRLLREQLGTGQLTNQQNQFRLQLAAAMSGMSPALQRDLMAIFSRMGMTGGGTLSGDGTGRTAPAPTVPTGGTETPPATPTDGTRWGGLAPPSGPEPMVYGDMVNTLYNTLY